MTKTVTKTVTKADDTMSNTVSTAAYRAARREEAHSAVGYMRDPLLLRQYRGLLNDRGNAQLSRALAWVTAGGIVEGLVYLAIIPTVVALASSAPAWGLGLGGWLTVLGVCAVVGAVCTYAMNLGAYRAALEGLRVMLVKVGDRLASLPLGWFDAGLNGRMSRLVTEGLMSIGSGIAHVAVPVLRNTIAALVLMVGVFIWQPMLGITLATSLLVIAALTVFSNRLEHYSHSLTDPLERELSSRIVEYASCQGALRSAGRSGNYEPLYSAIERSHGRRVRALWISTLALVLGGMSTQIVAVSLIYVSVQMALTGLLDPVSTVVFIGVMLRFTRAIQDAVSFLVGAENSRIPLVDVNEILSSEPLPVPEEPAHLSDPGSVSVENVSFSYTPGVPVLRSLSFTAEPGSLTAIVGPSGSGKTTVFKLLARFWDVDSGTVRVGGVDVRKQRTEQLMAQLSMVFQDVYLFDGTLMENIRVGREDATDEQVLRAASLAGADEIAARLPEGWQTRVGEGGGRLSGGERQRVSIARALLKDAPILLFDEATSALDPENEASVQQSIRRLRQRSTVLVIAHKLDTVRDADQIVVLDEHGALAQIGTHEELVAVPGVYRTFWQARVNAAGWKL